MRVPATVLAGGQIVTVSGAAAAGEGAEAVAIAGDRILAVGDLRACREVAGPDAAEVDLAGGVLVPGFVDPHCHPLMYGQCLTWIDCSPARAPDIATLITRLRDHARELAPHAPVRGFGYNQDRLADGRHPTADELDAVAVDRPVVVMHASGHGYAVNHRALEQIGVNDTTPDPPGGSFGRDAGGRLDGRVWDAACDALTGPDGVKIGSHGPNLHLSDSDDRLQHALDVAQARFLQAGVTTVADMQVTRREMRTYLDARDAGRLRLRFNLFVLSHLLGELEELGLKSRLGDGWLAFSGLKLYADGAITGATAYFADGYHFDPCYCGHLYHPIPELHALIERAHRLGLQTGTHAQGDTAIGHVLDGIAAAQRRHPRPDPRHRIEHCGLPAALRLEQMRSLGVLPIGQPRHVELYGDGVRGAIGEKADRYMPYGEYVEAGIPLVLSSDAPVSPPGPLAAIASAARRVTVNGNRIGPDSLRITVAQALRAHTLGAAYSLRREHELGSIEAGKRADFAILDRNPLAVPVEEVGGIEVRQTWVGGEPATPSTAVPGVSAVLDGTQCRHPYEAVTTMTRTDPKIAPFTECHLDGAVGLSHAAGWPHRREDWAFGLRFSTGVVALVGERVVATALVTPFGNVATANMIIVDETMRGNGLGRTVMNAAMALAAPDEWRLIATRSGLPLYRKLGFTDAGPVVQHQGMATPRRPSGLATWPSSWAGEDDVDELSTLDREATGMDRAELVRALLRTGRACVLRDASEALGYGVVRRFGRGELIGPVVARDGEVARAIYTVLLAESAGSFVRTDVYESSGLSDWLAERGLAAVDRPVAMVRGGGDSPREMCTIAIASQALG